MTIDFNPDPLNRANYCAHNRLKRDCSQCFLREIDQRISLIENQLIQIQQLLSKDNMAKKKSVKTSV